MLFHLQTSCLCALSVGVFPPVSLDSGMHLGLENKHDDLLHEVIANIGAWT